MLDSELQSCSALFRVSKLLEGVIFRSGFLMLHSFGGLTSLKCWEMAQDLSNQLQLGIDTPSFRARLTFVE